MLVINKFLQLAGKNWKTIAIVLVAAFIFFSIKGCISKADRIRQLEKVIEYEDHQHQSEIKDWKDKNGELHTQVDNLYVDHFALQFDLDSIQQLLSVKPKQVISYSKSAAVLQTEGKLRVDTFYKKIPFQDSSSAISVVEKLDFGWFSKDSSTHVWGTLGNNEDSVHVFAIDTLSRTDYWKRSWFLGSKHYYSDFNHSNKDIKLVGYQGAQLRQRVKKWSLGASILYGYPVNYIQLRKPVTSVGVSLQYSFLRF